MDADDDRKPCPYCKGRRWVIDRNAPSGRSPCGCDEPLGKWALKTMDYIPAKDLVGQLEKMCEDKRHHANELITEEEREDYAEAIRVVLEYLP